MTEKRFLTVGDEQIPYEWERKAVKRLNLRVRPDGTVHLSVPRRVSEAVAEKFLAERADWLKHARERVLARRDTDFAPTAGAVLHLQGQPHRLVLQKSSRCGVTRTEGALILSLRDPADEAEARQVLYRFIKAEARRVLMARAREIYPLFAPRPATFPTITVRWMTSRWGSCTAAKNHITLNEKLLLVPPALADYVIYHEFCHFKHQDHSAAFYRHLSTFVPSYAAARKALRNIRIPPILP